MSTKDALVIVLSRNLFYKKLHYLALATLFLVLLVIGILSSVLYFLTQNPPRPVYFAADNIGRLITIVPISKPHMTTDEVIAWTVEAVQNTYSYDYVNFRSQMQNAQKYFTNYGWLTYMKALTLSGNLPALTVSRQIVIAQVVPPVKLIAEGILGGAYAWKFQMQVLLTVWKPPYDDKSKFVNALDVSVVIQRQEILQSYKGLGILQLVASMPVQPITQQRQISSSPTAP